ncbi:MAG: L,D-transpeptidase family protein [Pseudomonadota bacterium]
MIALGSLCARRPSGGGLVWVLAALSLAFAGGAAPKAHALSIELVDVAPDRIERQRRFVRGEQVFKRKPDTKALWKRLKAKKLKLGRAIFVRVFKAESELEIWMRKGKRYTLLDVYPICQWSGTIGPKIVEGDRQSPEGIYTVKWRQTRRVGKWPKMFNIGYPNRFDRDMQRTGSYILVHGGCSSVGCFAMTDDAAAELHRLGRAALRTEQRRFQVQVFPFRMTDKNMARYKDHRWHDFWSNLRQAYDHFERTKVPPRVSVCAGRYVVDRAWSVRDQGPILACRPEDVEKTVLASAAITQRPDYRAVARVSAAVVTRKARRTLRRNLQASDRSIDE